MVDRGRAATATVRVVIKDKHGAVVRRATRWRQRVGIALEYRFRCYLQRGVYDYFISATDVAGNWQTTVASNHVVVR